MPRTTLNRIILQTVLLLTLTTASFPSSCLAQNRADASPIPVKVAHASSQFLYREASFPSCHAATIAVTRSGKLISCFFGGSWEGCNDVCIWQCEKHPGDTSWTAPHVVARGDVGDTVQHPCWNPVLFQMPGHKGELLLFYKTGIFIRDWVGHLQRSTDGGETWSRNLTLDSGYLGAIRNVPILIGKRLICPSSDEKVRWCSHFEISEDRGRTWRYIPLSTGDSIQSIQPTLLEHKDGTLQSLSRTKEGFLATTFSHDGGLSWETEHLTRIPNNNSGIAALTLHMKRRSDPLDGLFVMVYNPTTKEKAKEFGPRTPLVMAVSRDGSHWQDLLTLDEGEGEFSYPTIIQDPSNPNRLHVVYTWNRKRIRYYCIEISGE